MHHASLLDAIDGPLLRDDFDDAAQRLARAAPVESMLGTMAWHHRERYLVQQARFALATGDAASAFELATGAVEDATPRGSRRYAALGGVVAARASIAMGQVIDHDALDAVLRELDECAALEAWLVTAELAAATKVDRWWRDAERRAGALVAGAGDHAETLRGWIGVRFAALGR
jgi:hypothetical protein